MKLRLGTMPLDPEKPFFFPIGEIESDLGMGNVDCAVHQNLANQLSLCVGHDVICEASLN